MSDTYVKSILSKAQGKARAISRYSLPLLKYYLSATRPLVAYWWRKKKNVGDLMGPYILSKLLSRPVMHIRDLPHLDGRADVVVAVGSILQQIDFSLPTIWGTGIIDPERVPSLDSPTILSVRGPRTRQALLASGYECPSNYGDPALLLDRYYNDSASPPTPASSSDIGIVLHYSDMDVLRDVDINAMEGVRPISVETSVNEFVSSIKSCRIVLSSSLHGIITAHAMGIPAVWLRRVGNKKGGAFKYLDYFESYSARVKSVDFRGADDLIKAVSHADKFSIPPPPTEFIDRIEGYMLSAFMCSGVVTST